MAIERKKITIAASANAHAPDELEEHLNDGWEVKRWRYDPVSNTCEYMLEREVPDHGHLPVFQ